MTIDRPELPQLETLLAQRARGPVRELRLERMQLRGGLEAELIERVVARFVDGAGKRQVVVFVAKWLSGRSAREYTVYRDLLGSCQPGLAPRLLAAVEGEGSVVLYLHPVRASRAWPWRDVMNSQVLLRRVAAFHRDARAHAARVPLWRYDDELAAEAEAALARLDRCRSNPELRLLVSAYPAAKRIVLALPKLRRQLQKGSFGWGPLHGDLHSGNVVLRRTARGPEPVLLDWGRARLGSPLEDVSSWLQSLAWWEPEARRRHDTLLSSYLFASGRSGTLTSDARESYWLAAATNVLSGALGHHLSCLQAAATNSERALVARRARDDLRVLVRADAVWS